MVRSGGKRSNTRDLFAKGFRQRGQIGLTRYLTSYKVGDYVDVKADPAVQAGMPHKCYHGRTGKVWSVTKRALGVEIFKAVKTGKVMTKRIHVRVEHVSPSRCREAFLQRREANDAARIAAKRAGRAFDKAEVKRVPGQPRAAYVLPGIVGKTTTVTAVPYDIVRENAL